MYHPRLDEPVANTSRPAVRGWTTRDIPDGLWPSDNPQGVPLLLPRLQANALDLPLTLWGTRRRSSRMYGTYAFYVDDYRFSALWNDPTPVLNSGCVNVVEPNYTVGDQTPYAVALWATYRKRWLARTWQEIGGLRVFVDLNVAERWAELNLLGVPKGWRAYATRGYKDRIANTEQEFAIAKQHRGDDDVIFLVYGGNKDVKAACEQYGWLWVPEQQDVAKNMPIAQQATMPALARDGAARVVTLPMAFEEGE